MPDYRWEISFFVMFRGRAMGLRRKFVLLGGFPVRLVHGLSSCGSYWQLSSQVHEADQSPAKQECVRGS
jgi:hypothetical protein